MIPELSGVVLQGSGNESALDGDQPIPRPGWLPGFVPTWVLELVATLVVIVGSWLVARLLVRIFSRRIAQHLERPSLIRVSLGGIRTGVYLIGFFTVLRIYGLDLSNIALSVTVFSAVVGVILAPIVGSVISGVFLLADQPYEVGDMIELADQGEGTRGFVEDITLRYTKIFTLDNTFLIIPNGAMRERDVINYSAEDTRTRRTLDVLITYDSDLPAARTKMEESAQKVDAVIAGGPKIRIGSARYPAQPDCMIGTFADDGILLRLRYWIKEPYSPQKVQSKVQENVWDAFTDADIEIAYPHTQLVFDEEGDQLQVQLNDQERRTE